MKLFNRSYYKAKIIITFCSVTALLVVLMAWFGYIFVRNMYLDQISEKINSVSGLVASQINETYLTVLEAGPPTLPTQNYFQNIFDNFHKVDPKAHIFIFDKSFSIAVHSETGYQTGVIDPRLQINEKEIFDLKKNRSTVSLPFKGDDGLWYLWGFYRLNNNYWLSIKESAANFEKVDGLALKFIYIGLAGLIATVILSLIIAKSISKPVDELRVYSSKIGKGRFDATTPLGMKGEFLELANAMESMKNDLAENQKEREKMLAQIAHEIRNPLGGIELLAGLTKEDLQHNGINAEYIERIIVEISRLKKLITAFLEFGKPIPANRELCNVEFLVDESLGNFSSELKLKDISIKKEIINKFIFFDKEHLKQIFMNIFSNSLDFLQTGGKISFESKKEKECWQLIISDDGKGIPDENLTLAFEPFFTTKKNGTGLGLAVCKKLCIENKAYIFAENKSESGTKFIINGMIENV